MVEYPTVHVAGLEFGMLLLSLLVAAVVAFGMVEIAARITTTTGRRRAAWLLAGSASLGAGIWAIGLAAIFAARPGTIPQDGVLAWTAPALAVASAALLFAAIGLRRAWLAVLGGIASGLLVAATHFSAISASRAGPAVPAGFDLPFVAGAAVVLAIVASAVLVWLARRFAGEIGRRGSWLKRGLSVSIGIGLAAVPQLAMESVADPAGLTGSGAAFGPASAGNGSGAAGFVLTPGTMLWIAGLVLVALAALISLAAADRRARRRLAETEALRRSEDRFRSLAEASAQIVWTTAPDGQMVDPQPSWSEFTGQEQPVYTSWGWFSAIHPGDREATAGMWEEALANREPVELEHRVRRHDGQYRDCVVRIVPVLEPDGRVREWVGTHTDVTDRARTREDRDLLVEAGRVLSTSLDPRETLGALTGLIVPRVADCCTVETLGEQGEVQRILSVHADPNKAELLREIETRFPTGPDDARGAAYVLRTEQSELIREVTEPVLREIAPIREHRDLLEKIGLTSRICVPLTARGQVLGALTIGLSEQGQTFDLRDLALAEELARRAATAIDNARLHTQLQEAVRGRDEVLGIVSHDLRNPLHTISMCTDLLLDRDHPTDQRRKHLDTIRRSAQTMDRLIQDLLDVSRTENGRLTVDPKPEDPLAILNEAFETMSTLAEHRSVRIAHPPPGELPPVYADRRRVLQVLSNLIGNAIKFTRDGGRVLLAARVVEDAVEFTVSDNGVGIPKEDLSRIFRPHWQAQQTAHLGAGLGLAISRGIVEAHGGRIWVHSAPGRGSRFHFTVPAVAPEPVGATGRPGASTAEALSVGNGAI